MNLHHKLARPTAGSRAMRAAGAVAVVALGMFVALLGARPALARPPFTPSLVLSDAQMRDWQSMSQADVQAFLASKPGPLKRMSFARHDGGSVAPASTIIWEASQAYHINPRVLLTMLQKEQSLITRKKLAKQTLNRAVGAGCPDSGGNRYPGFGNQLWNSARLLDGYGEPDKSTDYVPHPWVYGTANKFTRSVPTSDLATYKLYVYNPSIGARWPYGDLSTQSCAGNANFWKIFWAYWGDPLYEPALVPAGTPQASAVTTVALDAPSAMTVFGAPVALTGRLQSADASASLAGLTVRLETPTGSGWAPLAGSDRSLDASGGFSFSLPAEHTERVRVVFAGVPGLSASVSGCFVSDVVPLMSPVSAPTKASARRRVRLSGSLAPAHASTVRVWVSRVKRGKRSGWRSFSVAIRASGAWTYQAKLPKGTWAVRAIHNDAGHAWAATPWVTVRVR